MGIRYDFHQGGCMEVKGERKGIQAEQRHLNRMASYFPLYFHDVESYLVPGRCSMSFTEYMKQNRNITGGTRTIIFESFFFLFEREIRIIFHIDLKCCQQLKNVLLPTPGFKFSQPYQGGLAGLYSPDFTIQEGRGQRAQVIGLRSHSRRVAEGKHRPCVPDPTFPCSSESLCGLWGELGSGDPDLARVLKGLAPSSQQRAESQPGRPCQGHRQLDELWSSERLLCTVKPTVDLSREDSLPR